MRGSRRRREFALFDLAGDRLHPPLSAMTPLPVTGGNCAPAAWLVAAGEGLVPARRGDCLFLAVSPAYYMLQPAARAFALEVGHEHIGTLFHVTFAVMLGVLPLSLVRGCEDCRGGGLFPAIYSR